MQVYLHGSLREQFPDYDGLEWHAPSVAAALRLLDANTDGAFFRTIRPMRMELHREHLEGDYVEEHALTFETSTKTLHVVPEASGSGRTAMIIVGTIIIAAAAITMVVATGGLAAPMLWGAVTAGEALLVGTALVVGGLMQPAAANYEARDGVRSATYNGGLNRSAEGSPVPLVFGRKVRAGGMIISSSIDVTADMYVPPGSDTLVVN